MEKYKKSFAWSEIIYMSSRERESKIIQNKPFHFVMNVNEGGKWKHTTARKKMWTKEREDNSTFYVDFESILWKFRVSQRKCTELELFFSFFSRFLRGHANFIIFCFIRCDPSAEKHKAENNLISFGTFFHLFDFFLICSYFHTRSHKLEELQKRRRWTWSSACSGG